VRPLPRFIAPGLLAVPVLFVGGIQPAQAAGSDLTLPSLVIPLATMPIEPETLPLPDPVRAMIDAAIASGERKDVETVVSLAKATNPKSIAEIEAILAVWQAQNKGAADTDPIHQMLAAAMASKKDSDVEAVGTLAKKTNPDRIADIDALLTDYRAGRAAEKKAEADAARARLAAAKFWQNWKGEGQIGASLNTGNSPSKGLSAGLALARKGLNWNYKMRAQADYQRTNGRTSVERFLAEVEPQYRVSDRAFAYGLTRWEQDRILGYDQRWNVSGGLGYKLIDRKTMSLSLKGGPAWRRTDFLSGLTDSDLTALAGVDFGWQVTPTLRLTQVASTTVGTDNTLASSLTALNAKLTGALSARLSYSADIDTKPQPGIEKVDTLTRFTLVYGF
jgi:putative salt-induced outer membrane protein